MQSFDHKLVEANTIKFRKPDQGHVFRLNLKQGHCYRITVTPPDELDTWMFLIDKELTIINYNDDEGLLPYLGEERWIEVTPDKTDYYFLVVINHYGKGKAHVVITEDVEII